MKKEVDIKDYVKILVKWRGIVIFNMIVITLLAIVISLVLPQKWTAVTTILPPTEDTGSIGISALVGGGFGGLLGGSALSRMLPGMATLSDLFAKELKSRRIMTEVLKKNDLLNIYKAKLVTDGLEKLEERTSVEVTPEGLIIVSVIAKNPELASQIANSYVAELDKFNREVNMTMGKKNRLFLERRLETAKRDLQIAGESLRVYKERYRTVSISDEMSAAIEVVANIKAQIMANEVKLGMLYEYSLKSNPEIIRFKNEIAQLKKKEKEIEAIGKGKEGFGAGFSIPFEKLPEVSLEIARRKRDLMIQEALYELITQQYEQAKIMEVRDTPTVQVLDRAIPPERRSFPKRKNIVIIAFIFSIFTSVGLSFLSEYIEKIKDKKEGDEWRSIGDELMKDFNKLRMRIKRKNFKRG